MRCNPGGRSTVAGIFGSWALSRRGTRKSDRPGPPHRPCFESRETRNSDRGGEPDIILSESGAAGEQPAVPLPSRISPKHPRFFWSVRPRSSLLQLRRAQPASEGASGRPLALSPSPDAAESLRPGLESNADARPRAYLPAPAKPCPIPGSGGIVEVKKPSNDNQTGTSRRSLRPTVH